MTPARREVVQGSPPTVESIATAGVEFALVIRAGAPAVGAHFVTPLQAALQVGILAHLCGAEIPRHFHRPLERRLFGTAEVLIVERGSCMLEIFDGEQLVAEPELKAGDVAIILSGGHGLRMLEDTVIIEVKQGPYLGVEEKVRY